MEYLLIKRQPGTLFDATVVSITVTEGGITSRCNGLPYTIIEVVQVLAWIGSALRESTSPERIGYAVTCLQIQQVTDDEKDYTVQVQLCFREEDIEEAEYQALGNSCWQKVLRNPVIAKGFPIPSRSPTLTGVETSLKVMASLVDASRLAIFDRMVILKGFNAAITLTDHVESFYMWHAIVHDDGRRVAYSDLRSRHEGTLIAPQELPGALQSRNILAWTPKVANNIGKGFPLIESG